MLSKVLRWVQFVDWPSEAPDDFKPFIRRRDELTQTAGVLLWGHRVVVPQTSRETVLRELHVSHPGMRRMKSLARPIVWWPGIDAQIEQVVQNCSPCQQSRPKPPHAELHPWAWPSRPWSRIHCDFAEPVRGKYVFCMVDAHSKWVEAEILPSTASAPVIACLRRVFARWGLPDMLVSDNATTFTSEFQRFLAGSRVSHCTIEPRHSQGNGLAERVVKEVKLVLQRRRRRLGAGVVQVAPAAENDASLYNNSNACRADAGTQAEDTTRSYVSRFEQVSGRGSVRSEEPP